MERRNFIKHTGMAGILAAGSAPAFAQGAPEVKWRLASSFPKSLDTIYGAAEVDLQARRRGHQRQVPDPGVRRRRDRSRVRRGRRGAAGDGPVRHTAPYYFFGKDPTFAFGMRDPVRHEPAACRTRGCTTAAAWS